MTEEGAETSGPKRWARGGALGLLLLAILLAVLNRERFDAEAVSSWIDAAGALGPLTFIGIYALAAVLFLPAWILTVLAGVLFGPWLGTLYSLTGATLGATLAFLTARHLIAERIEEKLGQGRLARIGSVDRVFTRVGASSWEWSRRGGDSSPSRDSYLCSPTTCSTTPSD